MSEYIGCDRNLKRGGYVDPQVKLLGGEEQSDISGLGRGDIHLSASMSARQIEKKHAVHRSDTLAFCRGMNKSQLPGPEEWRQIIAGQRASGLTVAAYCRDRGIKDSAYHAWKRRLRSMPIGCVTHATKSIVRRPDRFVLLGNQGRDRIGEGPIDRIGVVLNGSAHLAFANGKNGVVGIAGHHLHQMNPSVPHRAYERAVHMGRKPHLFHCPGELRGKIRPATAEFP
jgi:hypothetical protein